MRAHGLAVALARHQEATREAAQELTKLVGSGKVTPQVGPTYALADSPRAFQDLMDPQVAANNSNGVAAMTREVIASAVLERRRR